MTDERMTLARYRYRRFLVWAGVVIVVLPIVAVLCSLLLFDGGDGEDDISVTATLLLIGIPLLIMLVVFGGFYLAARRGVWWLQASPGWAVRWSDRRRIGKAVREGRQLSGFEQVIALDTARRMRSQIYIFPLIALTCVVNLVLAIAQGETWRIVFWSALAVFGVLTAGVIWRDVRRGRRYLEAASTANGESQQ